MVSATVPRGDRIVLCGRPDELRPLETTWGWRLGTGAGAVAHEPAAGTDRIMVESLQGTADRIVHTNEATGRAVVRLRIAGRREAVTAVGALLTVSGDEHGPR
jgi:hypothetical protein